MSTVLFKKSTPTKEQLKYHKEEKLALLNLSMNTFTHFDENYLNEDKFYLNKVNECIKNLKYCGFKTVILNIPNYKLNVQASILKLFYDSCKNFHIKLGLCLDIKENIISSSSSLCSFVRNLMKTYNSIAQFWIKGDNLDIDELNLEECFRIIKKSNANCIVGTQISGNNNLIDLYDNIISESWPCKSIFISTKNKDFNELKDSFFNSVGKNLIAAFSIDLNETISINDNTKNNLLALNKYLSKVFSTNLIISGKIIATNDNGINVYNILDNNYHNYWTCTGDYLTPYIQINFDKEKEFNILSIQEYIPNGANVQSFKVYAYNNGWFELYSGKNIGYKHLAKLPTIKSSKVKISFLDYTNPPVINKVGLFKE
ncbi:discoidin domain-containing protein [Clostridium tarantellae]|uniref:F5/8 type C domain-containing protein n=1 Tax=Clostridium tarantellae TaxID=39493 RepID=A0A6I1MKF5_9CLOT|nr:discoidin domain-containing protein [Clostridium tarantellae]MPQ44016.1 hypothetical protein [Clostridium tarantellae]